MANRFEDLPLYKEAHPLVLSIYRFTKKFPPEEKFGLISQLRRSSSSIMANIIEGNAHGHRKEFLEFLYIARGSLEETKYHLLLSRDLGYLTNNEYSELIDRAEIVGKQLRGLIHYIAEGKASGLK